MAGYAISIIRMRAPAKLRLFDEVWSTVVVHALFGFNHATTRAALLARGNRSRIQGMAVLR